MSKPKKSIAPEKWEWFGGAAHFICGYACRFHMATKVGKHLVSTVGQYWPERPVREIHAKVSDPKWLSEKQAKRGEDFDHAYMKRFGFEEIGYGRKFETMVFKAGAVCDMKDCPCGCIPQMDGAGELDFKGYNDAPAATAGHMEMCRKWASK